MCHLREELDHITISVGTEILSESKRFCSKTASVSESVFLLNTKIFISLFYGKPQVTFLHALLKQFSKKYSI
jgi:hypothetical protein